jgi:hypothetical protein
MTPLTLFASLSAAAALGAAGYATMTGTSSNSFAQLAAGTSDAAESALHATATPAPRARLDEAPRVAPAAPGDEPASPRECRPEDGVTRDCTYE